MLHWFFCCFQSLNIFILLSKAIPVTWSFTEIYPFRHFSSGHRQEDGSSAVLTSLSRNRQKYRGHKSGTHQDKIKYYHESECIILQHRQMAQSQVLCHLFIGSVFSSAQTAATCDLFKYNIMCASLWPPGISPEPCSSLQHPESQWRSACSSGCSLRCPVNKHVQKTNTH